MRWQKFMTILVLSLTLLPFQNCTQIVSFRVTGLESSNNKNSDSGGNGGTYDGKITFLYIRPGFECENQKAPKAILRRDINGIWTYTTNEPQKCGFIKDQIVTDVVYTNGASTLEYQNVLFFQDNTAPEATNLNTYVNEYLVSSSVNPNTSDQNQGDGLCADSTGQCSFRAAIDETNASPNKAHIIRLPAATYNMQAPIGFINNGFIGIYGADPNTTLIENGGQTTGIFTTPMNYTSILSLQNVTLRGGASNAAFSAAAINVYGSLYANNLILQSNGPGISGSPVIYAGPSSNNVLIENSRIIQNTTSAIRIFAARSFIISNTEISDNTFTGVHVNNGTANVHIQNSVITRNRDGVIFRECHSNCTISDTAITQHLNNGLALFDTDDQYTDTIIRNSQITGNGVMTGGNIYLDVAQKTTNVQLRLEDTLILNGGLPRPNCTFSGFNNMKVISIGSTTIDDSTCAN